MSAYSYCPKCSHPLDRPTWIESLVEEVYGCPNCGKSIYLDISDKRRAVEEIEDRFNTIEEKVRRLSRIVNKSTRRGGRE